MELGIGRNGECGITNAGGTFNPADDRSAEDAAGRTGCQVSLGPPHRIGISAQQLEAQGCHVLSVLLASPPRTWRGRAGAVGGLAKHGANLPTPLHQRLGHASHPNSSDIAEVYWCTLVASSSSLLGCLRLPYIVNDGAEGAERQRDGSLREPGELCCVASRSYHPPMSTDAASPRLTAVRTEPYELVSGRVEARGSEKRMAQWAFSADAVVSRKRRLSTL
ncbi:hypothetical protein CSOJ01_01244 [Colletotrichum sojae]|uniref:Uncharacterized protein n=1 Tax=Colletotrichum sojae TaxID=2175907 RepID=A0A8H6JVB3_9PEZI|nr:hypothetical protein CSOJ01_01244 [Colletotrichum sojae]